MPLSPRLRWKLDRFREQMSGLFGAQRPENARPRLCPACGTLVGATATRCHQCGANMTFSMAAASRSLGVLLPTASPATYAILTFSCVMYLWSFLWTVHLTGLQAPTGGGWSALMGLGGVDGRVLTFLGMSYPMPVDLLQPWRLVMAVFLHGSLLHIGFNMWVLMDIGPMIEELYGSARFVFIYVVTGIGGYLLSSAIARHPSMGGSGALLGLIGVMLALTIGRKSESMRMLRGQMVRWLIYIAIWGFVASGIDNYAHLGGFATGFVLGKIMLDRAPVAPEERKRAQILGWTSGLAVAISMAIMLSQFFLLR
ncbi:MAG: rhomboid family intramembrane serine protease [Candidatus Acidiferrales bacterium]